MKRISALLLAFGLTLTPPAFAQSDWSNQFVPKSTRDSHKQEKTVPLSQILQNIQSRFGGNHIQSGTEKDANGNVVTYRVEWLTGDGRRTLFIVDARTGRILDQRGA